MNNGNHVPEDDLILFALQFLPEDRMRDTAQHLNACDACRAQVAQLQGDLVAYAMTAGSASAPVESRERLLRQIAKEPKLAPVEPKPAPVPVENRVVEELRRKPERRQENRRESRPEATFSARQSRTLAPDEPDEVAKPRSRRAPWVLAWTGWAVAAGCSFVAGLQVHQRQQMQNTMAAQQAQLTLDATTQAHAQQAKDVLATLTAANVKQVALHLAAPPPKKGAAPVAAPSPEAMAAYIAEKGALVFFANHLDPVANGKTYELWLLPADVTKNPIPAGTFKPDAQGNARVMMPQLPKGVAAKGFGVTIENAGGSTEPTPPLLMSGT
jgi:hypothetical protein